jgi:hypothetical protein
MKRYKSIKHNWTTIKLDEELRLSDFKKHAGISDFTKKWKNIRLKKKGAANVSARLIKMKVNKKKDYITFIFYSAPTYTLTGKVTNPNNDMKFKTKEKPWYTQEIRILDFWKWARTTPNYQSAKKLSIEDLKEIFKVANIQVWCNDPSYHWQGMNYISSMFDASVYPTDIYPKYWTSFHNDDNFLCKHLDLLLSSIDFWLNPMVSMVNKYLKEKI